MRRRPRERGVTLIELLMSIALLGVIVLVTASIESMVIRRGGEVERGLTDRLDLTRAAGALARDARRAASIEIRGGAAVLTLPDGTRARWEARSGGLTRSWGGGRWLVRFPGVTSLSVRLPRPNLLQARLETGDGGARRLSAALRNPAGAR